MKKLLIIFLLLCSSLFLSACWDSREINTLFIVSGIAIDKSEQEGYVDVCLIGIKTNPSQTGSASSDNEKTIVLETTTKSIREAMFRFNIDNDRTIYLQHNQIVIFGEELAKENLAEHLDFFVRSENSRLEVVMMIVEGRAEEVFKTDLKQEQNFSTFLFTHIQTLSRRAKYFKVSILQYISILLTDGLHPAIPIFKLNKNDDDLAINMTGFAIFRDDKMIAKIEDNDLRGYFWLMGNIEKSNKTTITEDGRVSMDYDNVKTKKKIIYENNIPVKIKFTIESLVRVEELTGFEKYSHLDLYQVLTEIANQELVSICTNTFKLTQELKVDIFGIGSAIYRSHSNRWKSLKYNWDNIYSTLEIEITTKAVIRDFGQIINIYEKGGKP